jgi:catechol 2,3-dioxygenase-like lactoylglutathione lyase family enzyme
MRNGEQAMEIKATHHFGLTVSNLARSLEFYEKMFGLVPEFIAHGQGDELSRAVGVPEANLNFAFLRVGNGTVELLEYDNDRQLSHGKRNCDVGAPHLCFDVPDIDAAYADLLAKGADFYSEPLRITDGPLAGCAFAYLRDPDGLTLEIFQSAADGAHG